MIVEFTPDRGALVKHLVMAPIDATPSRIHALAREIREAMKGLPRETRPFIWSAGYCRERHGKTAMMIPGPHYAFHWSVSAFNRAGRPPHLGIGCTTYSGHHVGSVGVDAVRFWRVLQPCWPTWHLGYTLVVEGVDATMVVNVGGLTPRPSRWALNRQPVVG